MNTTCEEDDVLVDATFCDDEILVGKNQYDNLNSDNLSFIEAEINGNCLILKIEASGCSGASWPFKLVDSEAIAESFPEQRYL